MKKILKFLLGIVVTVYFCIGILLTVFLLKYNEYKVTEIGNKSFLIMDDKSEGFKDGDLVIADKGDINEVKVGDTIFFYEVEQGTATINQGTVQSIDTNYSKGAFVVGDKHTVPSESYIGNKNNIKVYNDLGTVLSILESKYGFLLLIIFPTLVIFLYEVYRFIIEVKTKEETEE